MTRMSKQGERRATSHHKRKKPSPKTGPKKEAHPFKAHVNALEGTSLQTMTFIPKIR